MNIRAVALAVLAGGAAFLLTAVAVIELLLPTIEFSVFVALPVGIFAGSAVAALVLFASRAGDDDSQTLANALGTFAATFLVAFAVILFGVGIGAVVALFAAVGVGVLGALAVYLRGPSGSA
ncbi:hypothetical protein [Halobellus salinisoli]|uniref:hypothetical protein n=1 Tax=Halobellus salinisoli TaxID=3108500 RepID=UPI00300A0A51